VTTISAKVIAHSQSWVDGKEILTFELTYPRFIHAEFMTHRQFSRNASSSRAIPVQRMIQSILDNPAMPLHWGMNEKGMQATQECDSKVRVTTGERWTREDAWLNAMHHAIESAQGFHEAGYHKQVVNRLLEPFMHITVVVTSTEWSNFYALRDHPDAEPHIALLAKRMREAAYLSKPIEMLQGQWHSPYVGEEEKLKLGPELTRKVSTARCARTSYLTHDGRVSTIEEDLALHDRLVKHEPMHASPAEHQATPDPYGEYRSRWGNFQYWMQYRKTLPGECR
jgi:hypothetical protein